METYEVKFWIQKPDGYFEQRTEIVAEEGKNDHQKAEDYIRLKYADQGKEIRIVSVIYQ